VGAQLYQPTPEENGLNRNLDRLAGLLGRHSPGRLAVFWESVMRKTTAQESGKPTISDQLRIAIKDSGLSQYAVSKAADIDAGMILRFMSGERTLRLDTVDKLAAALGLRLVTDQDDATPSPDPNALSLAPSQAANTKEQEAFTIWYDNLRSVGLKKKPAAKLSEDEAKQRELFLEWNRRQLALSEEFTEKLRKLS
jgi:transcriptional regulator with XRE-family HTH domain